MRMSLIESDLKSRIEEEIREIAERRASEIIEDHLAKTAESPCAEKPAMRAVAPTMMDESEIVAVAPPVRSVPPVAYASPETAVYASPNHAMYSERSPYSAPPPAYSAPPPAYSAPPPGYHHHSAPPRSSYGPPSSHPSSYPHPSSMHPASMHPMSMFPHSTPNYIVWPELSEPTMRGAIEAAAPRRGNALLMAIATLALGLSGAAFAASTGHLGTTTASAAPMTKTLPQPTQIDLTPGAQPQAEDATFAAPAPTLRNPSVAQNDAPRWSRRYKGPDAQLAAAPVAAKPVEAKPVEKAATKEVKPADPAPTPAPEQPAPPAPSMDSANKTAQMLREQLNSSVK